MRKQKGVILLGIILGFIIIASLVMWYGSTRWFNQNDYPYYNHMIGGWGMPFGMIAMGIFWIVIIYFLFNGLNYREEYHMEKAVEALKTRLAKGEITIDEYEALLEKIKEKS
ncbi:MAG: hypothetical protein RBQ71_05415 [Acholeplasmataceae bacterium]|jgi:putative membrane protein|nr:hypothetical protein [Acholeplasmataceae bacterium]